MIRNEERLYIESGIVKIDSFKKITELLLKIMKNFGINKMENVEFVQRNLNKRKQGLRC